MCAGVEVGMVGVVRGGEIKESLGGAAALVPLSYGGVEMKKACVNFMWRLCFLNPFFALYPSRDNTF